MQIKKPISKISTRGYYDLDTGKQLNSNPYYFYPGNSFKKLIGQKEIVIMIHGLRNDKSGANTKFVLAKKRLQQLRYAHPVIGFSYDSNTKGAHLKKSELKALRVGQKIAQKNGNNLAKFVVDFKTASPKTKIRLMGHSLGSQVIQSTLRKLAQKGFRNIIESVYFFGASIQSDALTTKNAKFMQQTVVKNIVNYHSPYDEVLKYAHDANAVDNPLGLNGATGKTISKFTQKKVKPKNHRFASYALTIKSFP